MTINWSRPLDQQLERVFPGYRYPNSAANGACPPASPGLVPRTEILNIAPEANRLVNINGAYFHALADAAGACGNLRTEFSNPKDAQGKHLTMAFNEKDGDEAWYGTSFKYPASGGLDNCWDSCGIFGIDSGSYIQHPSYGGGISLFRYGGTIRLEIKTGHCPSLQGSGFSDALRTPGITDWVCSFVGPGTQGCSHTVECNGYVGRENILGPAAPRPLELTKWHDLIFHVVFRAHSNGVLQVWHRLEGGSWELLYSDVPGDGAVVQRAPHPTMQWNLQYDAAGSPKSLNEPASIFMQMYRGKLHATEHIYNAGIVRRQSEAAVRAVFP